MSREPKSCALQHPGSLIAPGICCTNSVHATIPQTKTKRQQRGGKTARSASKVACRVPALTLTRNPDPLCDNLTYASAAVVHCRCNTHGDDRWHVASHPRAQRTGAGKRSASAKKQAAVSCGVCVGWQESGCEPSDTSSR